MPITLRGSCFGTDAVARMGEQGVGSLAAPGHVLATEFASSTQLQAFLPPSLLSHAREAAVWVSVNNVASQAVPLTIGNPMPYVTSVQWGADVSVLLRGSGFMEGTALVWNGTAYPMSLNGPDIAQVALSPSVLDGAPCKIVVRNPPPGGGLSNEMTCPRRAFAKPLTLIRPFSVVWDARRRLLYATHYGADGIAVFDAERGVELSRMDVEAGPLALSSNDAYLFVGGLGLVRRIDLDTRMVEREFGLPAGDHGMPVGPAFISVAPGRPDRIAVSAADTPVFFSRPLVVMDGAVASDWLACKGCYVHAFVDEGTLVAVNNASTGFDYYRFDVTPSGVQEGLHIESLAAGFVGQMDVVGSFVYLATYGGTAVADRVGQVLDARTGTELGRIPGQGTVHVDAEAQRAYLAESLTQNVDGTCTVWASDSGTLEHLGTFEAWGLPAGERPKKLLQDDASHLLIIGHDGIYRVSIPGLP